MTVPVLSWKRDFERSGPDAMGLKQFVTLTITSDANGQWDAAGHALPNLKGVGLGGLALAIRALDGPWRVAAGAAHVVLPKFDLTTVTPVLTLVKVADGTDYVQAATGFASKNLTFKLEVFGQYEG